MPIQAGTQFGRYEIRSKIGAGGMGEVYLAEDTKLERTVALKILPADVAQDQQRMRRFVQEAKAASALNHPNILTIHEVGEDAGINFIATEFIEGETLRQHIRDTRVKLSDALNVAIQAADALAAAHEAGIVHRDIKPENIMLRKRDAYVKVLDFGLAKLIEQQPATVDTEAPTKTLFKTGEGVVVGTVIYMSPEQARGLETDARTDIWSLGVVLYEMVAGCLPFEGSTMSEILASILNEKEPPPLARFAREVPAELERIVEKALRKDREERYQTAKDMLLDLRRLKHKLEVDAEIERTVPPELRGATGEARPSGGQETVSTAQVSAAQTATVESARTTSSVEYIITEIKGHKRGVLIGLVIVALAIAGLAAYLRARNTEVAIESIAVLPFANQNHDPDSEYLSDGLTESIINRLTQLPNLKVIARSSVFHYKGKETDPIAVGKELGVRAVLTGRIIQRGDNLTISAELVDVRDNKQLWGEQYERKVSDLLAVQREIAKEIASNLRLKLSGAEQSRVTKHYTENPEAYQLYLKGRFYWNKRTGEALKKSIEYFNQAIEKDPSYALAYAGLADAYVLFTTYAASPPQESYPKAIAAAKKALELDETLAEAHTSLGYALMLYDWNLPESTREFQRAIELNPNYATLHHWYPVVFQVTGRMDDAIGEMKRAQELDPLSLSINTALGRAYYLARQYDKAIEQLRKTIEMDQNFYYAHWMLGLAYEMKGSFPEAITEYQKARQSNDDPFVLALLGHALAASGKREDASRTLDQLKELSKQRYVSAYSFAIIHAGLGERDQAFQWLEKGYQARDLDMPFIRFNPLFDNLRADPRFADLVRRMGL